jgi:methylated-DNA-[protein]-cysteine S-methyltransferase
VTAEERVMNEVFKWIQSPIGRLKLVASDAGLAAILWENDRRGWRHLRAPQFEVPDHPILLQAETELGEYFAGKRERFSVKLDLHGTEFQQAVWQQLLAIPFGQTRSYGEIARLIGRPKAVRAVGAAVGMNPVSIMAPCHRVLGSSGTLTGFAGGLQAKLGLLAMEHITYRPSAKDPDLFSSGLA